MKLELEVYDALCSTAKFVINDIEADTDDFGEAYDANPDEAEPNGCGNFVFEPKLPTNEVLEKYNINVNEYKTICEELRDKLSFGSCGWCV